MKFIKTLLFLTCILGFTNTFALTPSANQNLNQDLMMTVDRFIIVLSQFSDSDYLTAYDFNGNKKWQNRFKTKILSWKYHPETDIILVFAKSRYLDDTYLICMDPKDGGFYWERP
ncbi:MAG: hypothetical protein Q8K60_00970 [Parachlamydiaceae bacterium]|nr:hypothetical protein [Parachlamydiaceae bacterium]